MGTENWILKVRKQFFLAVAPFSNTDFSSEPKMAFIGVVVLVWPILNEEKLNDSVINKTEMNFFQVSFRHELAHLALAE